MTLLISPTMRGLNVEPNRVDVVSAIDGDSAFEMACNRKPDLIITDLVLREGAYIVRRFRSDERFVETPIFVLTGQSYPSIKHQVLNMGVDAFLTKPVTTKRLVMELREYIRLDEPELTGTR